MGKRTRGPSRWNQGLVGWLVDQAIERWPSIVVFAGGGVMTYLASISDWLAPYGPVAWGAVGVASLLLFALAYYLVGLARERVALAHYVREKAAASGVNILAPTHTDERVELSAFYHPFYRPTESVRFENCDIFGPANVVLGGGAFIYCGFHECEIVIIRDGLPVMGAMVLNECQFVRCRLYRITFLNTIEGYRQLPDGVRANLPVISDGRIGNI